MQMGLLLFSKSKSPCKCILDEIRIIFLSFNLFEKKKWPRADKQEGSGEMGNVKWLQWLKKVGPIGATWGSSHER